MIDSMLVGLLASAALLAAPVVKEEPAPLAATGQWTVHAEEKLCLLSRTFGTGGAQVTVGFQPIFNDDQMDIILLSAARSDRQEIGQAKLRFAPSGTELTGRYYSLPTKSGTQRYARISLSADAFTLLQSSAELSITARPQSVRLALPRTEKAVAAFRTCEADLLRSWGVDPAAVTPERAAKPLNPGRAFGPANYPSEARQKGYIGRVVSVVQVDANGMPTACRVVAGVAPSLNEATCNGAMVRVRYQPGTDAAGKPAASVTVLAVSWRLST